MNLHKFIVLFCITIAALINSRGPFAALGGFPANGAGLLRSQLVFLLFISQNGLLLMMWQFPVLNEIFTMIRSK